MVFAEQETSPQKLTTVVLFQMKSHYNCNLLTNFPKEHLDFLREPQYARNYIQISIKLHPTFVKMNDTLDNVVLDTLFLKEKG